MNRKLISKAISDIDDAFIAEAQSVPVANTGHSPERTSNMGKYENKKSKAGIRRLSSLAAAACLVFSLGLTAYALNLFGIREMFKSHNRELPEAADPYIQHQTEATTAQEDWSARVTESLCDSSRILVTVSVSGGDKYIVAPTDASASDSVALIGISGEQTLEEYAASQGKQLLFVGASLLRNEHLGVFTQAEKFVSASEREIHILVDATRSGGEATDSAICYLHGRTVDDDVLRLEVPFTLSQTPATNEGQFVPVDANAIPGITVIDATVEETPLGWTVRIISTVPDQHAFDNIKKMDCDEITDFEGGGFVLEDDGTWSTTWSMGKGNISNTLTVHFYDWDNELIGDILFMKK